MNKRGQIASTITGVAGFLIIFFIVLIFIIVSAALPAAKPIDIVSQKQDYSAIKNFIWLLGTDIKVNDETAKFTDLFTKKDSNYINRLNDEMNKLLLYNKPECYIITSTNFEKDNILTLGREYNSLVDSYMKDGVTINLPDNSKIEVYMGQC